MLRLHRAYKRITVSPAADMAAKDGNMANEQQEREPIREYHFSLGNSSRGSIGFCARVRARSRKEAVEALQSAIPESEEIEVQANDSRVVYLEVYFNTSRISPRSIDEVNDTDDQDEDEDDADCGKCVDCGTQCVSGGEGSVLCPKCDKCECGREPFDCTYTENPDGGHHDA